MTDIYSTSGTPAANSTQNLGIIRVGMGGINDKQTGLRNAESVFTNPLVAETGRYDARFDNPRYYTGDTSS